MYRFKSSKYRNAIAKIPKKEAWITEISVSSGLTHGNLIKASAAFVAFHQERPGGGTLDVLPLKFRGKPDRNAFALHCHSDLITDFDFSPFDDGFLATASQDCTIKLWRIPQEGLQNHLINPEGLLSEVQYGIENVLFHPTVDVLLSSSSFNVVKLWDLVKEDEIYSFSDHDDVVQSFCWHGNGSLIGTSCKDRKLRILDPRSPSVVQETTSHSNPKDSRIIWLGDTNQLLSTGFQSGHERQIVLRDIRAFSTPLKTISFDNSIGILLPFYDRDTNMLFIAGKADASVTFLEASSNDPFLTVASKDLTEGQTKGMCLVPKRALNVMQGEVNCLLQLTQSSIVPITYQVPRKTYREFHADLFPNTIGTDPGMTLDEWLLGQNVQPGRISLDPLKRTAPTLQKHCSTNLLLRNTNLGTTTSTPENTSSNEEVSEVDSSYDLTRSMPEKEFSDELSTSRSEFNQEIYRKPSKLSKPVVLPKPTVSPVLKRGKSVDVQLSGSAISLPSNDNIEPTPFVRKGSIGSASVERRIGSSTPIPVPTTNNSVNGNDRRSASSDRKSSLDRSSFGSGSPKASWVRDMVAAANAGSPSSGGGDAKCVSPKNVPSSNTGTSNQTPSKKEATPPVKPFAGFRISKFRHLKGTPFHKNQHVENLRNLSTSLPRECNGIDANKDRIALSLKGPGGRMIILELSKPGRIPDGILPVVQNVANVMDFTWDPFNTQRLAVACDDAVIRLWLLPHNGLTVSLQTPCAMIKGHAEKVNIVKFHPLAEDILASCSLDLTVRIWDLITQEEKFVLQGHLDQIFSLDWSSDGKYFATVSKDNRIRIYNPRMSSQPTLEGTGSVGNKGARLNWVLQGKYIICSGFDRVSERQIKLFSLDNLNHPLTTVSLDVSPAILVPHYDEDSCTVFLTGKGDSTIYAYEVLEEPPYLFPLSHHKCASVHQAVKFLNKNVCNVRNVEFARCLRLSASTIEPISFTVPRVKMDVFQHDLFPDTMILWEKTVTKDEWLLGMDKPAKRMSLHPTGMQKPTENTKRTPAAKNVTSFSTAPEEKSTKEKEQDLVLAMSSKLDVNSSLEQDSMEGVDPSEWLD